MLDLTNCDREPIHIPNAIQPHGVLLVVEPEDFCILQVSDNTEAWLGQPAETLLRSALANWIDSAAIEQIQRCLSADFEVVNPLRLVVSDRPFDAIVHGVDGLIVLELEPTAAEPAINFFDFYRFVKSPLDRFQQADNLDYLCQAIVQTVKEITGFDRVMVYRFHKDGVGSVIAEACQAELEPFLGLHYPATDIPNQARALYQRNPLRLIPDATYRPVTLVPEINPVTQQPLNMSQCVLRSVSPLHLEYLHNMQVTASMSISLVQGQHLWGLIACHHASPKRIPYSTRTLCEFIGQVAAIEIKNKEESQSLDYRLKLAMTESRLIESIAQAKDLFQILEQYPQELLSLVNATGAVIYYQNQQICLGTTPQSEQVSALIQWLEHPLSQETCYCTTSLSKDYPDATDFADVGSGLLALTLSRLQNIYILWFRPEVVQTIHWGGQPDKRQTRAEDGTIQISPRTSFALWQEIMGGQSEPWLDCELEIAQEFRSSLLSLLMRNADELVQVNRELSRSNDELDAFAYIASHDLKEPLRGIHNYASFLIEDYGDRLDEDGVHKLNTLMRLTQRMEDLINSLLHFSRLGRVELNLIQTDLNLLVRDVLETLKVSRKTDEAEILVPQLLPVIRCDRIQINELFSNLLSNAIKYNESPQKRIEVGWLSDELAQEKLAQQGITTPSGQVPQVFYVMDNGIGIRDRHLDTIFRIFKRLHGPQRYGGGTGAGLTIVKKIVERHSGIIWVESIYGEGTTFYFTLQAG